MRVSIDWDVDVRRWRRILQPCGDATFFHTPGWYQTQAELSKIQIRTPVIRWPDGQEALLPLAVRARFRGWLTEAVSGIENGYGGLVSAEPLSPQRINEAYRLVRSRFANLRVLGNPLARNSGVPLDGVVAETFTQAVPILDPDAQRSRMSEMRRRHLRKAEKAGFELERIYPLVPSDTRDILSVYQEHSSKWQYRRWVRDEAYFRALFRHSGRDLVLFIARHQGAAAGFLLLGCWGQTLVELHLATLQAYDPMQVGTFLIAKPLEWAHASGYRTFDFLASGQLDGIIAYKESFGSDRFRQVEVSQDSAWSRLLTSLRQAMPQREELA